MSKIKIELGAPIHCWLLSRLTAGSHTLKAYVSPVITGADSREGAKQHMSRPWGGRGNGVG